MKLFLDTNILLDFILERKGFWDSAASILSYAEDGKVVACVSTLTIVNAQFICVNRYKMPKQMFKEKMDTLRTFLSVFDVNSSDVFSSFDKGWKDFEDGVQYYCALRNGSNFIVTRNVRDFEESQILAILPDEAIELITEITD